MGETRAEESSHCSPSPRLSTLRVLSDADLLSIEKPAQYLGGEKNSIVKNEADVDVRIALAFPDAYEVGMSHLGIQILYDLINRDPAAWAERVYMPFPDMEALLRRKSLPLTTLEAARPLAECDVVGFSLQYELCGTNILTMLELAGIPFFAADRGPEHPLIIGGGPYCYHPEALAPFFDAFFLGDAEEFIPELLSSVRESKATSGRNRHQLIDNLRQVEGVYLPGDFVVNYDPSGEFVSVEKNPLAPANAKTSVVRRLLPTMEGAPFPKRPVVPGVNTVHNRLSLEVMRGCVRGCRFCQAGYLYRPQRERPPEEILSILEESLGETGFEEVSLLSLSTADYCSIVPLLRTLMDRYGDGDRLAISFPSTRVDALTPEVLEQVQRVRRTGFTVAPEGGSQRLRDVINKGVTDEQILETCNNVFTMGWTGIKLYFMLGLPTETDEDLEGIVEIARRIRKLPDANGKDITVSVSTHVPKPHTPFQWAAQITPEETIRRQRLLAGGLRKVGVNFRYHEHFSSFLEGVFCRGGRELAQVIVRAYQLGSRLDAWKEHLKEDIWFQAFADCAIDPYYYLQERDTAKALPWDHLSCGIPKSYFAKEWKRALRDRTTADCLTTSCSICEACDYDVRKNVLWPRGEAEAAYLKRQENLPTTTPDSLSGNGNEMQLSATDRVPLQRMRIEYAKNSDYRFLGHLELMRVFHRASRRAALPVSHSKGFHPMPRLAFAPPLPLGVGSESEYFDIYFDKLCLDEQVIAAINSQLPPGLLVHSATEISIKEPSLQQSICGMRFRINWISQPQGVLGQFLAGNQEKTASQISKLPELVQLLETTAVIRKPKPSSNKRSKKKGRGQGRNKRVKAKKDREFILSQFLTDVSLTDAPQDAAPCLEFSLRIIQSQASPTAVEVVRALSELEPGSFIALKTATFFESPETVGPEQEQSMEALAAIAQNGANGIQLSIGNLEVSAECGGPQ